MQITRVTLVFIPFIVMTLACFFVLANVSETSGTLGFQSPNVTMSKTGTEYTESLGLSPVDISTILAIVLIISIALAICLVAAIHVFGSGISGSVLPILFFVTIAMAVYGILSGISWSLFTSIPYMGLPIFFALLIMFVTGVASLCVGTGGD